MLKAFRRLWNDKRGNALIIAGAALPLVVGSAGLATTASAVGRPEPLRSATSDARPASLSTPTTNAISSDENTRSASSGFPVMNQRSAE